MLSYKTSTPIVMAAGVFLAVAGLTLVDASMSQAQAASADDCVTRDTNGMVTLVICPPGLDVDGWRAAGTTACDGRLPCGAWIWDDAARAPEIAPDSHNALRVEEITAAVAIWVEEDQRLITLEEVRN